MVFDGESNDTSFIYFYAYHLHPTHCQRQRSLIASLIEAGGNIDKSGSNRYKRHAFHCLCITSLATPFFSTCIPLVSHPHLTQESVLY